MYDTDCYILRDGMICDICDDVAKAIFRPHRICVAYRCHLYLAMFMVCESVIGHADVLWQNGWSDQHAVWHVRWGCLLYTSDAADE